MYHENYDKKEKMQPSKEGCIVPCEAVRVAGFKSPWGQAAAKLFSDSWLFRLFLNLTKSF